MQYILSNQGLGLAKNTYSPGAWRVTFKKHSPDEKYTRPYRMLSGAKRLTAVSECLLHLTRVDIVAKLDISWEYSLNIDVVRN